MKNELESASYGSYLKAIRLEKKISLEQVAEQTRVGMGSLLLIEQEEHEQLPAEVFVKGFIRAYAAAIGADGDEAIRRYELRLDVVPKMAESEASGGKSESRRWWKLIVSVGLLLCIIAVSVVVISFWRPVPESEESAGLTQSAAENKPEATDNQGKNELSAESVKAAPEKLALKIIALESTWIKVIIDEKESTEYQLKSGDEIELEAGTGYSLLIGNAEGLKITLDDKPVFIPGQSGQAVTMHLP
jgi:cytoskeleton protein RodZ